MLPYYSRVLLCVKQSIASYEVAAVKFRLVNIMSEGIVGRLISWSSCCALISRLSLIRPIRSPCSSA